MRVIHTEDAIPWLRAHAPQPGWSVVTSLPDVSEVGLSLPAWRAWFEDTAALVISAIVDDAVAVFFQTDIIKGGVLQDKSHLVTRACERAGARVLWHKVACRKPPGAITFGRPAYTHVLAASRAFVPSRPVGIPDVIVDVGEARWVRAMGVRACAHAVRFVKEHAGATGVLDPFCGVGTVPAVAEACGLFAVGVERNKKRAAAARTLVIEPSLL